MEDDRRKFLLQLLAAGGGAAVLPEFVEAAQATVKLERPIESKILKRESVKSEPFIDTQLEIEMLGANGVRHLATVTGTLYDSPSVRRDWSTMRSELFESPSAQTPVHSDVTSFRTIWRKVDANHEEITLTIIANGKTVKVGPVLAAVPANRVTSENMSDQELIDRVLAPKLGGVR